MWEPGADGTPGSRLMVHLTNPCGEHVTMQLQYTSGSPIGQAYTYFGKLNSYLEFRLAPNLAHVQSGP